MMNTRIRTQNIRYLFFDLLFLLQCTRIEERISIVAVDAALNIHLMTEPIMTIARSNTNILVPYILAAREAAAPE